MRPEMTGETLNGRSISVSSRLLPQKSYLAMSHAAATPKAKFRGTTMPATSKREADRGERLVLQDGLQVGDRALGERLGEHDGERHEQEERHDTRARCRSATTCTTGCSDAVPLWRRLATERMAGRDRRSCASTAATSAARALMTSRMPNDAMSSMTAMAVAPA